MKRTLLLLLSILLSISTTVIPKKILIIVGVQYGAYIDRGYERKLMTKNVTDKFFNRKKNTNWMNDTFGDPIRDTAKQLRIQYRKFDTKKLQDAIAHSFPGLSLDIKEKTEIRNLIENPDAHIINYAITKSVVNPISYAIEKVEYGSKNKNTVIDVTEKFTNRPNGNWMNETFEDPYPGITKTLFLTYKVMDEEDYNKLIQSQLGQETPVQNLELSEQQGIGGL